MVLRPDRHELGVLGLLDGTLREQGQGRLFGLAASGSLAGEDVDLATQPGAHARVGGLALEGMVEHRPEFRAVSPDIILEASHGVYPSIEAGPIGRFS